jgi:hypothetical protein
MKAEKQDIFSKRNMARPAEETVEHQFIDSNIAPTGLTMDQAYEKVGAFGRFNVYFIIPVIMIYTFGQVIYLATPLMKMKPAFQCWDSTTSVWYTC